MHVDVALGQHRAGEDTLILGANLVITRDDVAQGRWGGRLLRERLDHLRASFKTEIERSIAAKGWR